MAGGTYSEKGKAKPTPPQLSRLEWALAFERKADKLRLDMGRKYMATVVATLWPKYHGDDPEHVAMRWAGEREMPPA